MWAGAHAYGLEPDDRPIIEAFMAGLERTRALKFDHPGLGTTVARSGARLVIQSDIVIKILPSRRKRDCVPHRYALMWIKGLARATRSRVCLPPGYAGPCSVHAAGQRQHFHRDGAVVGRAVNPIAGN
jgi:hypothetical protein